MGLSRDAALMTLMVLMLALAGVAMADFSAADNNTTASDRGTAALSEAGREFDSQKSERDEPVDAEESVETTVEGVDSQEKTKLVEGDDSQKTAPAYDISSKGACSQEIVDFCSTKKEGASELSDCITSRIRQEKKGNLDDGKKVSDGCKKELRAFKVARATNITLDKKLADACVTELRTVCAEDDFGEDESFGDALGCLRGEKSNLSAKCKEEVFRTELDAAQDFQLDSQLAEACADDAGKFCKDVPPGDGGIQNCLRAKREKVSYECQEQLFRQEEENADDIRLNVRLFRACLNDKLKFCKDVTPGDARVKDCLEDHRHEPDFSPSCKEEFDKMMEARSKDFRLDAQLKKFCKHDIEDKCYGDAYDVEDLAENDAKVIQCLQDYRNELDDDKCRREVHRVTMRAAEKMRFDAELAASCKADRESLCKDVEDEGGKVFRCLQEKRESLHKICRKKVFQQEVRSAASVDFKPLLKAACNGEIKNLCSHVLPGERAAVIKCLQDKVMDEGMGDECRKEVRFDEIQSAQDWRLNYRLSEACKPDIRALNCSLACSLATDNDDAVMCGGTVLKCLQEKMDSLNSTCKDEIFFFNKKEAEDLRLDVPLQRACKDDLARFCPGVRFDMAGGGADHGRILKCLRNKRKELTEACRSEEMRYSVMEASDIRLQPTLMNACAEELQTFCENVGSTNGEAFKCLQEKLEDFGMGAHCKAEVILQELRHTSNYRLDVRVRKECETDVEKLCAGVDKGNEGHAEVLKCFISNYKKLTSGCKTEVSYAVRMALWEYQRGNELTQACDADVKERCSNVDEAGAEEVEHVVLGVFGQCLLSQRAKRLSLDCRQIVRVASAVVSHSYEETLTKIDELKDKGFTISGWFAIAASVSFVAVIVGSAYAFYIYYNPRRPYTLVVKGAQNAPTKFGDV